MAKRLYRSRTERFIAGVCGGLANYFNIDPVLMRVIFVVLAFASGVGIIAYIVLWIITPVEGTAATKPDQIIKENIKDAGDTAAGIGERIREAVRPEQKAEPGTGAASPKQEANPADRGRYVAGLILLAIGGIALLANLNLFWWFAWARLWPIVLIIIGLVLILGMARRSGNE